MSHAKAIASGWEHRNAYRPQCPGCSNHGHCNYCRDGRTYFDRRWRAGADQQIRDWSRDQDSEDDWLEETGPRLSLLETFLEEIEDTDSYWDGWEDDYTIGCAEEDRHYWEDAQWDFRDAEIDEDLRRVSGPGASAKSWLAGDPFPDYEAEEWADRDSLNWWGDEDAPDCHEMPVWWVTVRFTRPAHDEREGVAYQVPARDAAEAERKARRLAEAEGRLRGGRGKVRFFVEEFPDYE